MMMMTPRLLSFIRRLGTLARWSQQKRNSSPPSAQISGVRVRRPLEDNRGRKKKEKKRITPVYACPPSPLSIILRLCT